MKGQQYIVMRMVRLLVVLIVGLSQFLSAQTAPTGGCSYLEKDKPSVYISYVRQQLVKNKKGKTEQKVLLRLHNNSTCEISVETPDNTDDKKLFKYETRTKSNGEKLTTNWQNPPSKDFDLDIYYDFKESKGKSWKPVNYWEARDLVFKYNIPSGYSAAFPVDERFIRKNQLISVLFEYDWEYSSELRTFGTISHRVIYDYRLPKGYFKDED